MMTLSKALGRARPVSTLAVWLVIAGAALSGESMASGAGTPSEGTVQCAQRVAATVQARYDGVRDFKANFTQRTRSVALGGQSLGSDAPSRGTVVFSKPGRMHWRYTHPTESQVISNGTTLWIVDPVAKEAQRLPVTEGYLTGAALEFLLGDGDLLETFDVSTTRCTPDEEGRVELLLDPKVDASYERLRLWAVVATGDIARTSLVDLFGNETTMSFSNAIVNEAAPPKMFEYEPTAGIRVIDLTPGR